MNKLHRCLNLELDSKLYTYYVNMQSRSVAFCLVLFVIAGLAVTTARNPDGAVCVSGLQCQSLCCKRDPLHFNKCAPLSRENEACNDHMIDDRYENCPCEKGLKCKKNVCVDPNDNK